MAKDVASSIVMCTESFVADIDGATVYARKGELLYSDDPLVYRFPKSFGLPKVRGHKPSVEQATAAPGEKRGA
jgi:hypothetical protein